MHTAPRCRRCTFREDFSTRRCPPQRSLAPHPGSPLHKSFKKYHNGDLHSLCPPLAALGSKSWSDQSLNCRRTGQFFYRSLVIFNYSAFHFKQRPYSLLSIIHLAGTHLAVELAVIDVERQRLSKGSFNVRLELLHLFSNLTHIIWSSCGYLQRSMYLNWVLVKDKLH